MSETIERFQTRAELAQFIEEQAGTAVEKALAATPQIERRVPWVTSGPVGQDSAGYSVLKAAAFALGFLGPEQAKEEIQVHQQLRELYQTYGFVPHCGHQSFLVPLATASRAIARDPRWRDDCHAASGWGGLVSSFPNAAGLRFWLDDFQALLGRAPYQGIPSAAAGA